MLKVCDCLWLPPLFQNCPSLYRWGTFDWDVITPLLPVVRAINRIYDYLSSNINFMSYFLSIMSFRVWHETGISFPRVTCLVRDHKNSLWASMLDTEISLEGLNIFTLPSIIYCSFLYNVFSMVWFIIIISNFILKNFYAVFKFDDLNVLCNSFLGFFFLKFWEKI